MLQKIKLFWLHNDKYLILPISHTIICSLLVLVFFLLSYAHLPFRLPLFYSLPWGQEQLVIKSQFLILPAIMVLTSLINVVVFINLHPSQIILRRLLMTSIIAINFAILVTALKIIYIFI